MPEQTDLPFKFIAGKPCLDFVDTTNWVNPSLHTELFTEYSDIVWWNFAAGFIDETEREGLLREADRRPDDAATIFTRGLRLRDTIHRVFASVAVKKKPAEAPLAELNIMLEMMRGHSQIEPHEAGFEWVWGGDVNDLMRVFWGVSRSAATLLTSTELDRVGQCAGYNCDWLFFDTSRNRSRRWCDMGECGNRAKARRYYQRHNSQ